MPALGVSSSELRRRRSPRVHFAGSPTVAVFSVDGPPCSVAYSAVGPRPSFLAKPVSIMKKDSGCAFGGGDLAAEEILHCSALPLYSSPYTEMSFMSRSPLMTLRNVPGRL
jgi:hypothetical protein